MWHQIWTYPRCLCSHLHEKCLQGFSEAATHDRALKSSPILAGNLAGFSSHQPLQQVTWHGSYISHIRVPIFQTQTEFPSLSSHIRQGSHISAHAHDMALTSQPTHMAGLSSLSSHTWKGSHVSAHTHGRALTSQLSHMAGLSSLSPHTWQSSHISAYTWQGSHVSAHTHGRAFTSQLTHSRALNSHSMYCTYMTHYMMENMTVKLPRIRPYFSCSVLCY